MAGPGSQISVEEWRGQQTLDHDCCCCFFNAEHVEQYSVTVHQHTCGAKMSWTFHRPTSLLPLLFYFYSCSSSIVNSVSSSLQISAPFTCTAFTGTDTGNRQLKLVNFEAHDNHAAHETEGLSKKHLVVRRGRPFKIQLLFGQRWNPHAQILVLEVWLGIKN